MQPPMSPRFEVPLLVFGSPLTSEVLTRKHVRITQHARRRLEKYKLRESEVIEAIEHPDELLENHGGRKIAHKFLNSYVLRIVYEENDIISVITVYPARKERYAKAS